MNKQASTFFAVLSVVFTASFNVLAGTDPSDQLIWKWKSPAPSNIVTLAHIPAGSAKTEPSIAVMSYGTFHGEHPFIFSLDAKTGRQIWGTRPYAGASNGGGWGDKCVVPAIDLDKDGLNEVLVGTAWGNRSIFALSGKDGLTKWNFSTYSNPYSEESGWITDVDPFQDINGDGIPEILFGVTVKNKRAYLVDGKTGEFIWQFAQGNDSVMSSVPVNDVNKDGVMDAFFGTSNDDRKVYMVTGKAKGIAKTLWQYQLTSTIFDAAAPGDLNGNNIDDVVSGDWSGMLSAFEGSNGAVLWQYSIGANIMRIVPTTDMDGDKVVDLIIGQIANRVTVVSGKTGKMIWQQSVDPTKNNGYIWAVDRINDLDGDGVSDVIAGSFNADVLAYSGKTGSLIWRYTTGQNRVMTLRSIPDINGDGFADVAVGTQHLHYGSNEGAGTLFLISGKPSQPAENIDESYPVVRVQGAPGQLNPALYLERLATEEPDR